MRLSCEHCNKALDIPDEKLPDAPRFRIRCPHCQNKTLVELEKKHSEDEKEFQEATSEVASGLSPVEPDIFPPGATVVFLHFEDAIWREKCRDFFQDKGFYVSTASNNEEAVQKLRLNFYDLICIEDREENITLLQEIAKWPGKQRARINFIMVGDKANSFDPNVSFVRGVDSYLDLKDQDNAQELLNQAIEGFKIKNEPWKTAEEEVG